MRTVYYEGISSGKPGAGIIKVHEQTTDLPSTKVTLLREPRRHSPDGFQWGYGGSGPSDTALAILTHALRDRDASESEPPPTMYHRFKFDVVADLDGDFILSQEDVFDWIDSYRGAHG